MEHLRAEMTPAPTTADLQITRYRQDEGSVSKVLTSLERAPKLHQFRWAPRPAPLPLKSAALAPSIPQTAPDTRTARHPIAPCRADCALRQSIHPPPPPRLRATWA